MFLLSSLEVKIPYVDASTGTGLILAHVEDIAWG